MNTGERPISDSFESLPSLMKETYKLCIEYVKNKDVLDIGCGEGYVDLYLSDVAKHVAGIDVDQGVVDKANKLFSEKNMTFYRMSGDDLKFQSNSFDVIISSQSIEHMKNDEKFLSEVHRLLKNNGIFICTTPNKLAMVPPGEKIYNDPFYPFHVREYMPHQFYGLLSKYFREVKKVCFYNPDRSLKLIKNPRAKFIYRISRFRIVRWLGRNSPLSLKEFILFFRQKELKPKDMGTAVCDYNDKLDLVPEVLCGICIKIAERNKKGKDSE
ncbi:class I SAM-dependent methyltransferase [bacterium]|nr:class I SAM-dependent methyltransferase [bacterium]